MAVSSEDIQERLRPGGKRPWLHSVWDFTKRKPLGAIGAVMLVLFVLIAIFAPYIARNEPNFQFRRDRLESPSTEFWFGTDSLGRDVYSRVIYGARISMYVGVVATAAGTGIGLLLGLGSAYFGGATDNLLQRLMDIMFSFPSLVLALALVAALGGSVNNVMIAIAVPLIPGTTRLVRSSGLAVKATPYMDAAIAIGSSPWRIVLRHMAPQQPRAVHRVRHGLPWSGHTDRGVAQLPGAWRKAARAVLGPGPVRRGGPLLRDSPLDGDIPGHRDKPGGIRHKPVRRRAQGRAGPQAERALVGG